MKPFYAILLLAVLAACNDNQTQSIKPMYEKPVVSLTEFDLTFVPKSETMVDIRMEEGEIRSGRVILPGQDSVVIGGFTEQLPNKFYLTASASYQFPTEGTDLLIEFRKNSNDTLFYFTYRNYRHHYVNELKKTQLAAYDLYLDSYDLTEDNQYLFFTENPLNGIGNQLLYRLNLSTYENELIDGNFLGREIRAVSENEILYTSRSVQGKTLGIDSLAMFRYDLVKKKHEQLAFVKEHQHYSRLVSGELLAWKANKAPDVLVIPSTGEEIKTASAFYSFLRQDNRDNLWLGNHFLNQETQELVALPKSEEVGFSYLAFNQKSQFALGLQTYQDDQKKLMSFDGHQVAFEEDRESKKSVSMVYAQKPSADQVIVHQQFIEEPGLNDGYYKLDIDKNELSLIQHIENPGRDFWIDEGRFISIRHDGIYLMEMSE